MFPQIVFEMAKGRRKTEEREIKKAHRKHRREQSRADGSQTQGDFVSLRNQLEVMGLTLREVPGDGSVDLSLTNSHRA